MLDNTEWGGSYATKDTTDPIHLTLTIGYGQAGSYTLCLDNKPYITDDSDANGCYSDKVSTICLGTNQALKGKMLAISATVIKVQPTTDSSLGIQLEGGQTSLSEVLTGTVSLEVGSLFYNAEIIFV